MRPRIDTPGKRGPKFKPVDSDQIFQLASILCTDNEIAAVCGVHVDTIRVEFKDQLERGRLIGKTSLRRAQWKRALEGSDTMLVWLGKQLLGQHDPRPDEYERAISEIKCILHPKVIG